MLSSQRAPEPDVTLRILATSDVHMHLSGYSDVTGRATPNGGLARLGAVIARARAEAKGPVLLIDNGDLLQGAPLAQTARELPCNAAHPLVAMVGALDYDVLGLGNHEFDFGRDYLEDVVRAMPCPVLSANTRGVTGVQPHRILTRTLKDGRVIRVGVTSALPIQTGQWAASALDADVSFAEPVAALEAQVAILKAAGADLVIVAAHGGLDLCTEPRGSEQFAGAVRFMAGVDAVIAGHTHQCVPGWGMIDPCACVMPGYGGAFLGCIDLGLTETERGWSVIQSAATVLPARGHEPLPELLAVLEPARSKTRVRMGQTITKTRAHFHSFFSTLKPNAGLDFLAGAMLDGLSRMCLPEDWAGLPHLAAVAPHMTGGRAGPNDFFNIPPGPVPFAAIESLFPFEDTLTARLMRGNELRQWLERAAAIYSPLDETGGLPFLVQAEMPGFYFDMIQGLRVRIDPRRPARFNAAGVEIDPNAARVVEMCWQGKDVGDEDRFVMAMSSYRANGGGNYPAVGTGLPAEMKGPQIRQLVYENCVATPELDNTPMDWALVAGLGKEVLLDTSPEAEDVLSEIACYSPVVEGITPAGFMRLRLRL